MKKIVFVIVLAIMNIVFLVKLSALEGYTTSAYIIVREGPGTNYSFIDQINYSYTPLNVVSEELINIGDPNCSAGWYKINYYGVERYICGLFVSVGSNPGNGDVNTSTFEARTSGVGVYVRTSASYSSSSITSLLPGTNLTILGNKISGGGCSGGWYKVIYDGVNTGYVCSNYVVKKSDITASDADYEQYLSSIGFPSTYIPYLVYLHKLHPTWTFNPIQTNLYWDNVIAGERGKNYLQSTNLSFVTDLTLREVGGWYTARDSVNAFYIDPRNFLTENLIFMFETQAYNYGMDSKDSLNRESAITQNYFKTLSALLGSSYLNTDEYKYYFIEAGFLANVSPVHLVTRVIQEGGSNASYGPITGTYDEYYNGHSLLGYYNYFNIGAFADSVTIYPINRGLAYACGSECGVNTANYYGTPWDTREKAIKGGAKFIYDNYIGVGQNTIYFEKFNTSPYSTVAPYTYQYMTNVLAPSSEAENAYDSYKDMNLLDSAFSFDIPIYLNMPESISLPTNESTINTLNSISINGEVINGFDKDVLEYLVYVNGNVTSVKIDVTKTDSKSSVIGSGTVLLNSDTTISEIKVTSESGSVKTYKISIIKVVNTNVNLSEVFSKVPVKVTGEVMYAISPGTTVNTLKQNILKQIPDASIFITDSNLNGTDLNDKLKTGYQIKVVTSDNQSGVYTIAVNGDVSGDGEVTILDLLMLRKHILNSSVLSNEKFLAADINSDGTITILDMLMIRKNILNEYTL